MVKALNCRNESEYIMNNIYNIISDIDVPNGHTKRMDCPNCGGAKTFTVTNNMGSLVWNCYKASCGIKGGNRFFFNDTATTAIYTLSYTLSLHAALPLPGEAGLVLAPVAVVGPVVVTGPARLRSEEHTSELQSHSEISYAVFCLKKK